MSEEWLEYKELVKYRLDSVATEIKSLNAKLSDVKSIASRNEQRIQNIEEPLKAIKRALYVAVTSALVGYVLNYFLGAK